MAAAVHVTAAIAKASTSAVAPWQDAMSVGSQWLSKRACIIQAVGVGWGSKRARVVGFALCRRTSCGGELALAPL